jgi:hypothetical protein
MAASILKESPIAAAAAHNTISNVVLPSPFKEAPRRQWNIPSHVATGEKQQQQRHRQQQQQFEEDQQQKTAGRRPADKSADASGSTKYVGRTATR